MSRYYLLLAVCYCLSFTACYEDNIACLDLDATNYDILADQACPDCCVFPTFAVDVSRAWGEGGLSLDSTYADGAGNAFRLVRFRTYLGNLQLVAGGATLPVPTNEVEIGIREGADTVLTTVNANLVLLSSSGSTTATVGRLRTGQEALTALQASIGLGDTFAALLPSTAPAASPLATQPDLLNRNDGNGYLAASAEYVLAGTSDTTRVDLLGAEAVTLDFGGQLAPLRGVNLTLEMEADYEQLFAFVDLRQDAEAIREGLRAGLRRWLRVTGVR